jgi:hypothetical protein
MSGGWEQYATATGYQWRQVDPDADTDGQLPPDHPDDPGPSEPHPDDPIGDSHAAPRRAPPTPPCDDEAPVPRIWNATDLRPAAQPSWLAKGRLQRGAVNLLVGDEGIGKSLLWVWITAAVTTGKPVPEYGIPDRAPARVLIAAMTEDDWSSTVCPRLAVAGADIDMVDVICTECDGSGAPAFPRDMFLIHEADPAPALIVVDAWLDTVPGGLRVRDPQDARRALHPWKELATATGAAVLLLVHTNRIQSVNARDRYGATYALRQKARVTLFAQWDDEQGRLLVGPEKMNNGAPVPASVFAIAPIPHFPPTEDDDGTVPLLTHVGDSDRTARQHVADSVDPAGDEPGGNPAQRFLYDYLTNPDGEAPAAEVIKAGKAAGFNEQELKDARRRARKPRIDSRKANFGGGWVWALCGEGGNSGQGGSQEGIPPTSPPSPLVPPSAARLGDEPTCDMCGAPLHFPASIERGRCEECDLSANTTAAGSACAASQTNYTGYAPQNGAANRRHHHPTEKEHQNDSDERAERQSTPRQT